MLQAAGFEDVSIEVKEESREVIAGWMPGTGAEDYVASAKVCAMKPDPNRVEEPRLITCTFGPPPKVGSRGG